MMREKVFKILREEFSSYKGEFSENTDFLDDLKADSVDIVGFVMSLEEAFDMEFTDEDIEGVRTVGDVLNALSKKLK